MHILLSLIAASAAYVGPLLWYRNLGLILIPQIYYFGIVVISGVKNIMLNQYSSYQRHSMQQLYYCWELPSAKVK